jgi:hypothetical protein
MQVVIDGQLVEVEERLLCLPCDPEYHDTLRSRIPPWLMAAHHDSDKALVVDHATGMFRDVDYCGMEDYVYGGEYDLVQGVDDEC